MNGGPIQSPLHSLLEQLGASFSSRDGHVIPVSFDTIDNEYATIRNHIGITDFSHMLVYRSENEDCLFSLNDVLAGNVASLRFGRINHTFLAAENGDLLADVYVGSNDDEVLLLCETCCPAEEVHRLIQNCEGLEPLEDVAVISLDGPQAWNVPADLLTRDILGMPYLSVETHELGDLPIRMLRAGKTGEFGYLLLVPQEDCVSVWNQLMEVGSAHQIRPCGLDVFDTLKMDGRFFNINREGRIVKDPLALGLQWMIDLEKEHFSGSDVIMENRRAGLTHKIVGMALEEAHRGIEQGQKITIDGDAVGQVITAGFSPTLGREMCLGLIEQEAAFARLHFQIHTADGELGAVSLSLPPFIPKSLTVKLNDL